MRNLAAAAVLIALVSPSTSADAAATGVVRHVVPSGADTSVPRCEDGTQDRPWRTLSFSFRCLTPGDTLLVHGAFREIVSVPTHPGTEEAPIVVSGAPGEPRPVIEGSLRIEDPTWWTIQDLEVVGDGGDYDQGGRHLLKLLGGSQWTVQRVELREAASYALLRIVPGVDGSPASHWRVLDSCIHDTLPAHGSPAEPPYPDHNLYVYTGDGSGPGLIQGNVIFGAPNGQNIKLGERDGTGGTDNVTIRRNTLAGAAQNISVVGSSDDNLIEGNVLAEVDFGKPWYPNVRGIHLSGVRNVARDNAWSGAAEVVHNRTGTTTSIIEGGNRQVSPGFEDRGCDGFFPTDPAAAAYGARAADVAGVEIPVERVAGSDRIDTSIRVSREVHERADLVLVARADAYPDALSSSTLAGLHGAPVLLSTRDGAPQSVIDEIRRLGASRVILLGGTAALGPDVETDLLAAGVRSVDRIAGANRFATATRVADQVMSLRAGGTQPPLPSDTDEIILVEGSNDDPGRGWPDAVSAGQLAAATGAPVLLTEAGALPADTRRWLSSRAPRVVTIVGGPTAVSDEVARDVDHLVGRVARVFGEDRYATAEAVADELVARRGADVIPDRTFVASGQMFPDAMAVGPAAALAGGVVVLYGSGEAAYERLRTFVAPVDQENLRVTVVGGPVAISETLETRWRIDEAASD